MKYVVINGLYELGYNCIIYENGKPLEFLTKEEADLKSNTILFSNVLEFKK